MHVAPNDPRPTPHVDRLLILLGYVGRTEAEDRAVRDHFAGVEDFEVLWHLARDNRVEPRVCGELERLGLLEAVPAPVRDRFREQASRVREHNRERLVAASGVLRSLAARGVGVAVVKGVAFGVTIYGDPGYKRMNDVDVFARRRDLDAIEAIYREHGFFPIAERVGGSPERQLQLTHHLPPYVNADLSCMLGTDYDFRAPLLGHDFDLDGVWARVRPLRLDGVELATLGPEDTLHHVCVHLERFRTGVRDIMDVHNVVFTEPNLDWERFEALVDRAGSHDDVFYALSFAQAHRPHARVAGVLARLAPRCGRYVRRLAARRTRSDRVLVRICSRQLSTIEKRVSAFNATGVLREKLPLFVKGWGSILWPSRDDALKIAAVVEPGRRGLLRARLGAPPRLAEAVAAELGGLLLAGLAVKSVVDLGRAALPFGEKRDLEAYARDLGLDLERLRAAQDRFQ